MRWGGAGGAAAPPNSGKQWVKFGQTVVEIRAKQEEKSHRQCPRGGGCVLVNVQE